MVKIGIIGLGFMAATHLRAYQQIKGVQVVALCNPSGRNLDGDFSKVSGNVDTGKPVRLDMGEVTAYRDVDKFLAESGADLIDLCTPTVSHEALAVKALATGRHVLCEKPLTRTVEEAKRIVAAAQSAQGYFMPAMCMRFWPEWMWLKDAIDRQVYGKVLAASFRRVAEPPGWGEKTFMDGAESGGALFDLHIHDTDFVQHCFGMPKRVFSAGYSKISGAVDHVVTHYEVASGAMVHAEGTWAMTRGFGFGMTFTVNFEGATADYDFGRGKEALKLSEKDRDPRVVTCDGPDAYVGELQHMIDAIESGQPPTRVTASDGLSSVMICAAEEESVRTGRGVEVKGIAN